MHLAALIAALPKQGDGLTKIRQRRLGLIRLQMALSEQLQDARFAVGIFQIALPGQSSIQVLHRLRILVEPIEGFPQVERRRRQTA